MKVKGEVVLMRIHALCGSLRPGSYNAAALRTAAELCDGLGFEFGLEPALDRLPFFNAEVEATALPPVVARMRARVGAADALLIASPEYAHGTSGMLKNALEWLVGGIELAGKPVAVITATPAATGGNRAQAWLRETLTIMGTDVLDRGLEIPLVPRKVSGGRVTHAKTVAAMGELIEALSARARQVTAGVAG